MTLSKILIILFFSISTAMVLNCGGGGSTSPSAITEPIATESVGTEIPATPSTSSQVDTGQTVGESVPGTNLTDNQQEIKVPEDDKDDENMYKNPPAEQFILETANKPGEIVINLPSISGMNPVPVSYEIWRGSDNGFAIDENDVASNGGVKIHESDDFTVSEFTDSNLADGTKYSYIIRYKYDDGVFSSGITASASTMSFSAPQNLNVFPGNERIVLRWTNPSGTPAPNGYEIYRKTGSPWVSGSQEEIDSAEFVLRNSSSVDYSYDSIGGSTVATVVNGTEYYYLVRYIFNDTQYTHYSTPLYNTSPVVASSTIKPSGIGEGSGEIVYTGINGMVNVSWPSPVLADGSKVVIYKSTNNPTTWENGTIVFENSDSSVNSAAIESSNGTNVFYAIYVQDIAGNFSNPYQFNKTVYGVIPVGSVAVTGGFNRTNISWTLPVGALRAEIYYSDSSQQNSVKGVGEKLSVAGTSSPVIHPNLSPGTYYYSVYAVFSDGLSEYYSELPSSGTFSAVADDPSNAEVIISQTSTVNPENIATLGGLANTYNWDQSVSLSKSSSYNGSGVIRYTTDGTVPDNNSPEYTTSIHVVNGETKNLQAAIFQSDGTSSGNIATKTYTVDYNAYLDRFIIAVKDKSTGGVITPNGDLYSSSKNAEVYFSYTPVCGEMFSIFKKVVTADSTDAQLGTNSTYVSSMSQPSIVYNRMDNVSVAVVENQCGVVNVKATDCFGKDYEGGRITRVKGFLKIAGRSYATDPLVSTDANPDLSPSKNNIVKADTYVIFPKLVTKAIDMWNRPAATPYLWIAYEPVVQVDVTKKDFFTGDETAADGVSVYFNVQYATKDKPYGTTADTVSWLDGGTGWPWKTTPDFTEPNYLQSVTGAARNIIDTEPFTNWYQNPNVTRFDKNGDGTEGDYFTKPLPVVPGRAYYQVFNPWDPNNRIGTRAHYSEINDTTKTGYLNTKAFLTVLRFRVRAGNTVGYRNADNHLKSFEPADNKTATFNTTNRIFVEGVRSDHASISDMPVGYRSYPIEVFERPQGWTGLNHYSRNGLTKKWYEKYGVKWTGKNKYGSENLVHDSVNKFFNPAVVRTNIFSHGWENNLVYELFMYQARPWGDGGLYSSSTYSGKANDYSSWLSATSSQGETGYEWFANNWIDAGYNLGFFHWNTMAVEGSPTPSGAELKIWNPTGGSKMQLFASDNKDLVIADSIRSANIGMMMAQSYIDSFPDGYNPEIASIAGHSLGNQVVTNATRKMIRAVDAGKLNVGIVPDRIDLLDPYWSNSNDYPGQTCRQYADEIHNWSATYGDDYDGADAEDSKGIPIQWFRTTALTQPIMSMGNDGNIAYLPKTNYQKIYDIEKYNGFVKNGGIEVWLIGTQYEELSGDAHSEAVWWYFRSIERSGDAIDVSSSISARSKVSHLFYKINSTRDTSAWRWYEMTGGQGGTGGGRKTITTTDDTFTIQSATSGAGSEEPEYD